LSPVVRQKNGDYFYILGGVVRSILKTVFLLPLTQQKPPVEPFSNYWKYCPHLEKYQG